MKLRVDKPVYGGDALAHVAEDTGREGKAVFVPLVLPSEMVSARLVEEKRNFAKAEVEQVLAASVHRVEAKCAYFGVCGGCSYQHADYLAQLAMKRQILSETLARAGVTWPGEIETLAAEPWGYRNRIRLAVTEEGKVGYRERRSHAIVPVHECPIAAPLLVDTALAAAVFLRAGAGPAVTEMELFTNGDESELLLTLICDREFVDDVHDWLARLHTVLPDAVTGIRLQLANGALMPRIVASVGAADSLTYKVAGFGYQVDHGAFFQVNRWLADAFVARVLDGVSEGKLAWDLFAGVGLFARQLSTRFERVMAVESAPASQEALKQNLIGTTGRAVAAITLEFLRRNREEREPRADLVVLDPPRAGLGDEVCTLLNAVYSPEMVYVSCDPATLARDLRALTSERYRIERVTLADMFPQTFHLETIVWLRRV